MSGAQTAQNDRPAGLSSKRQPTGQTRRTYTMTTQTPTRTGACIVCGVQTSGRTPKRYVVTYVWYSLAGEQISDTAYVDAHSADEARQIVSGDGSRAGGLALSIRSVSVSSCSHWRCSDFDACANRRNARRKRVAR